VTASSSRRLCAAALAAVFSSTAVLPQVGTGRVLLATVVDATGRPIVDLSEDDFAIEEGGESREVFSVHVADYPVVLLVHEDATAGPDRPVILRAAARFLRRVGEERAVAVGVLSGAAPMLTTFADDRGAALDRLERLAAAPAASGVLAPLAAVAAAARMVQALGSPFSAVVVAWSPSRLDDRAGAEATALAPVFESRTLLHVVSRTAAGRSSVSDDEVLRDLAARSGGQYTPIYAEASYGVALDRVADRLGTEMMVEFVVPAGSRGEVRAGVRIPGARVQGLRVSP
jgi:hypothetical protein